MLKEDFYKGVKVVGFVSFIPFILAAGPLTGYFIGTFLQKKFNLSSLNRPKQFQLSLNLLISLAWLKEPQKEKVWEINFWQTFVKLMLSLK